MRECNLIALENELGANEVAAVGRKLFEKLGVGDVDQ